ncbi:hypothetical protein C7S18_05635 [Ahniella affigens]|uniref:Uncharacterized protein n=1 Tax=Ahniella affigens TaxID=2021234 RepID=A0A2P1PPF4_9GAMM|nr:hypothetical protein [Ahniella affigens]AVP96714.1 hypothetical protein C7S18_05635 [Ahniella affigens]
MRYLSLAATVFCVVMLFVSSNPTVLGLCLLGIFLFGLISVFAFAQAKIASSAPPVVTILSPKELAAIRERAAANKAKTAAGGGIPATGKLVPNNSDDDSD